MTYLDPPEGPGAYPGPSISRRTAIPATCQLDGGPVNPTTLLVSKRDGTIVLDPHVAGSCVITLDEESATKLRDMLTDWLA
jgi:hypothetical protein